jgi:5-methylcytosine-specific restriction endonuclease McrA
MFDLGSIVAGQGVAEPQQTEFSTLLLELVDAVDGEGLTDAGLVDELAALERLTSAAAAAKARLSAELHARRRAQLEDLPTDRCLRGVAHEVALARRESPHAGREHLGLALALVTDMPETLAALGRGDINEHRALIMVRETADLPRVDRRTVDATLGPQLAGLGNREVLVAARRIAYELDTAGADRRARRARARRKVTWRPLGDGMGRVTADVRAEDAVAAMRSLRERADQLRAAGDGRCRDQLVADELVERLTRPGPAGRRGVEVQLVMNGEMLLGTDTDAPAHLVGYGPVPAGIAGEILADAEADVLIRRLYAHPADNTLVAMDSKGIVFPAGLRRLLFARDGEICRTPWCDAPVRHGDHVIPRARGGLTTLDDGQGLCEDCNYAKEAPGWRHETRSTWPERHLVEITTPTRHTHWSQAPPLPVPPESPPRPSRPRVDVYYLDWVLAC